MQLIQSLRKTFLSNQNPKPASVDHPSSHGRSRHLLIGISGRKISRKPNRTRTVLTLEKLELRDTQTAGIAAWLSDGTLFVAGTDLADEISLRQSSSTISVHLSNAQGSVNQSFARSAVTDIKVLGLGGADTIDLGDDASNAITIDAKIFGGGGNDALKGGRGADLLFGDGMTLFQSNAQGGGVKQIIVGSLPTGKASFVLLASGDLYTWDSRGSNLLQSASQAGGVQQLIRAVLPGGDSTILARMGTGDVYAVDSQGWRRFQSGTEMSGVQQLIQAVDPATKQTTTLALFGSGDVYSWDARGSRLFQSASQFGVVQQLVTVVLPGGSATTLARFSNGAVYAWDAAGARLFQSASEMGGVKQLIAAIDPATKQSTTLALFQSGDVYAWDAKGFRLFQSASQAGGVQQIVTSVLAGGATTTLARFGSGDVYAWDAFGARLFQSSSQLGGVQQLLTVIDPTTKVPTTLARFGSGDVYSWDTRGSKLFQTAAQRGGVSQMITATLAGGVKTTLARFANGDVFAWDDKGSRLFQTATQLGGVKQLITAVDPSTKQITTLARFGSGDVYSWDARGSKLFQSASQFGGVQELRSGLHPQTNLPTTFARFADGKVYSWGIAGIQNVTGYNLKYTNDRITLEGVQIEHGSFGQINAIDDHGQNETFLKTSTGNIFLLEESNVGGNDTIYGGQGNDQLFGGVGSDALFGTFGQHQFDGGYGDDLLSVDFDFANPFRTSQYPLTNIVGTDTFKISVDLGSFSTNVLQPFFQGARQYTAQLQPIIDLLNSEVPVVGDYTDGITFASVIAKGAPNISKFIDSVAKLNQFVSSFQLSQKIDVGTFQARSLSDIQLVSGGLPTSVSNALPKIDGLTIPVLQQPNTLVQAFLGEPVAYITYDIPDVNKSFNTTVWEGDVPTDLFVGLRPRVAGGFDIHTGGVLGFDREGVFAHNLAATFSANLTIEASYSAGLVEAGIGGRINATSTIGFIGNDRVVRLNELASLQATVTNELTWLAYVFVTTWVEIDIEIADNPLESHWEVGWKEHREETIFAQNP